MANKSLPKILLIGGHMTPALAVAEELQRQKHYNIVWVGTKFSQTGDKNVSAEYKAVLNLNVKFINLTTGKLWRRWTIGTFTKGLKNLLLIPLGFVRGFFILLKEKPDVIIGFGSYLMVPIIFQKLLIKYYKTKVYIHEQTISPSLSSKLTYRFADEIFVSWEESKKYFKHRKVSVSGNPIENSFLRKYNNPPLFRESLPILLILGGNQGSNTFNKRLKGSILKKYLELFNVIHQTGRSTVTNDYSLAQKEKIALPSKLQKRYLVYDFINPENLSFMMDRASLVLSRSGANTMQKILIKGLPAILMPIPWSSNNEQQKNAQIAEATGLTRTYEFKDGLTEEDLFNQVKKAYEQILTKSSFLEGISWTQAKNEAKKLVKTDAAIYIANKILHNQK